jgi:MerR family transcriptional regulator, copper efflux regulator
MQHDVTFSIGAMAARTSLSIATIRYYEEIGLIPEAFRRDNGHRYYGAEHEQALILTRNLRTLGFPLEQIRQLATVMDSSGGSCRDIRQIAQDRLATIRAELLDLQRFERSLAAVIDLCTAVCSDGPASNCCIARDLGISAPSGEWAAKTACCDEHVDRPPAAERSCRGS